MMKLGTFAFTPRADHAIAVLLCAMPLVLTIYPLAAVGMAGALFLAMGFRSGFKPRVVNLTAILLLMPFLAWMMVTTTWSPHPGGAIILAGKLALLLLVGFLLAGWFKDIPLMRQRAWILALGVGLFAASLFVLVDMSAGGIMVRQFHRDRGDMFDLANYFGRGAIFHALILPPIALVLWRMRRRWFAVSVVLVAFGAIFITQSLSAKLAVVVGMGACALFIIAPVLRFAVLAIVPLVALATPFLFPPPISPEAACWLAAHKASALHRLMIWNFVADRIQAAPIAGAGLDAARSLPGGDAPVIIRACLPGDPPGVASGPIVLQHQILPLHPHNGTLQVWLELGGIGMVLLLLGLCPLIYRGIRAPAARPASSLVAANFLAALIVAQVSFGIWQEWFLACLMIGILTTQLCTRLMVDAHDGTGTADSAV